jgi:sulfhydrogenase subunit gamma (sulfur reductase)
MEHIYEPYLMRIAAITQETSDTKTFRLVFTDPADGAGFTFQPGQFGLFSVFGHGEAPFGLSSSPTRNGAIEFSVKRVGKVTNALHGMQVGDTVGFRGPYGRGFPIEELRGKHLLFAGGGIGMAPLRSLLWNCLDRRDEFGDITVIYGARSVADLVYKPELQEWAARSDMRTILTVDPGGEDATWTGEVGFVPAVLERAEPSPENTEVITCGPPVMIRFVIQTLTRLGFAPAQIITTLEAKMKCGLGKCGRCNIGPAYVCKHGPVFRFSELQTLPPEY